MSQNSKLNRARRAQMEEKKGNKIFTWIIIGLLLLGVLFCIYTFSSMS